MGAAIQLIDQVGIGQVVRTSTLELVSERLTVKELIEQRVRAEVRAHNKDQPEIFSGLVQPTEAEQVANGYQLKKKRPLDENVQCAAALEAFEHQRFLLLIDDAQVDSLDQVIVLKPGSAVAFVKLVPLVGG